MAVQALDPACLLLFCLALGIKDGLGVSALALTPSHHRKIGIRYEFSQLTRRMLATLQQPKLSKQSLLRPGLSIGVLLQRTPTAGAALMGPTAGDRV
ncbi:hypothetical protein SKAU_G00202580 [Synaphobranchus kaupii]|uniref:Secreted protein n=1 Tax=Synaphobranchus kaupii TaxID=118154 RepID=A0A9Q1FFT6_SYNKA|nr:hypothetical protein SKAU_G00202580 [Synaphobranchus kaupii]